MHLFLNYFWPASATRLWTGSVGQWKTAKIVKRAKSHISSAWAWKPMLPTPVCGHHEWLRLSHSKWSVLICLFVCWVNKTRAVKPLRCFHSWTLSFTQDGPAFSTKTARRALQFQLRSALSTSWRSGSPFKINNPYWSDQTRQARLSHLIGPPDSTKRPAQTLNLERVRA